MCRSDGQLLLAKQEIAICFTPIQRDWTRVPGNQNTGIEYVGIEITGGMKVISDEDLKAWHKGIEIVDHVYEVTS